MYRAKVFITLRKSILDPKGKATLQALHSMGFNTMEEVRIGKYIELRLSAANEEEATEKVKSASEKLLANLVMEDYSFELEKI